MENIKLHLLICPIILLIFIFTATSVNAQIAEEEEDEYFVVYDEELVSRFYFSRKYTALQIHDKAAGSRYRYEPNSTLNIGLGATYQWATLNLAYGFGFLNPDRGQGKTRYLDLQAHAYPKKFVIDFFGEFYKGYYLLPEGKLAPPGENFYVRPDLVITKIGANVQYLFNFDKLSLRASFLQNERQRKSAGSFLLGFEMYGGRAMGDSHLLPAVVLEDGGRNFRTLRFLDFGPNAGYGYTWVINGRFFITAVASSSLGLGYSFLEGGGEPGRNREWGIKPNFFLRGFAGYNYGRWSVNANYVHNRVRFITNKGFTNSIMTGNYRLNFIYRFLPGPGLKRILRPVREIDF
jgi:hypothetical protein